MKIITNIAEMQALAGTLRSRGNRIGFVPTMGFLHEGHLSLMRTARQENDALVVSIFVNPTQFGPGEDLDRYPRDADGDQRKCGSAAVDYLFMPTAGDMYPEQPSVFVNVEGISEVFEGAIRPGHFRGVATVVAKLFHVVMPHSAYFGQKDFQQCAVIRQMARGLNFDVVVRVLATVREQDGLAMSSRNSYLTPEERRKAVVLYRAFMAGRELFAAGEADPARLKDRMRTVILQEAGVSIDYIEIVNAESLSPLERTFPKAVFLAAIRIGRTRLIDNIVL